MTELFNKKSETHKRKELRHQMPKAEVVIWTHLKGKQMLGHRFRRQFSVGPYVLDFYCPKARLAIEIDGDSHFQEEAVGYDKDRQALIEKLGIRFLRFTNSDVYKSLNGVLEKIADAVQVIKESPSVFPARGKKKPPLNPLLRKEGIKKAATPLLTKESEKRRSGKPR